jgi:hypothetical protein
MAGRPFETNRVLFPFPWFIAPAMTVAQDNVVEPGMNLDLADPFAVPAPENATLHARAEITFSMQPAHIQPEQL